MDILKTTIDLMKIPSEIGNLPAQIACLNYCKNKFHDKNVFIKEL